MPELSGGTVNVLTVADPVKSAAWYEKVLGFVTTSRYPADDPHQVNLSRREVHLNLCLVKHADSSDRRFDEGRIGLDHLEFLVEASADLEAWLAHFDELGVEHSGIKTPQWSSSHILTFRDPDGIQLELYWSPT